MQTNYNIIKIQLRKYSFEFLKVSDEPLQMLERLKDEHPTMIEEAHKPNLLAAAIVYVYLRMNDLNGRGGISAKAVGEYFGVKGTAISAKASDVEFWLYDMSDYMEEDEEYEYIDRDRFEVNEMYWEFIESEDAEHIEKSIKILKGIIKKDPDYFDPYITLHEYYLANDESNKAIATLVDGYDRAINLIVVDGKFPDKLLWGFIENRHIIRMIFNYALLMWRMEDKEQAVTLMLQLLRANPGDHIGARYYIVAILEGFESEEEFEINFMKEDEEYLDWQQQEAWFQKKVMKYRKELGWWLDMEEEEY
jgi:tetratricopeptide (TPR) repeat protein